MKATIDIKTPAGKSLEGFPFSENDDDLVFGPIFHSPVETFSFLKWLLEERELSPVLHPGDTITITIV